MHEITEQSTQRIPLSGSPFRAHSIELSLYGVRQSRAEFGQFLDCLEARIDGLRPALCTNEFDIVLGMVKIWDATNGRCLGFYDSGADLPGDESRTKAAQSFVDDVRAQLTQARQRFVEDNRTVSYLVEIYPRRFPRKSS